MYQRVLKRTRRRGTAAVELAVCLPVLLVLLVGVWEVGRMIEVQQLLATGVREGGRQASTGIKSLSDVKQYVVSYLHTNGITKVSVNDVTFQNLTDPSKTNPMDAEQMDRLRVSVSVSFDNVRWSFLDRVTNVDTLSASADWFCMKDIPITVNANIPAN